MIKEFAENAFGAGIADKSILQGLNDYHKTLYMGPCPPSGTHRYHFKIYALDTILELKPGATKQQLLFEFEGHLLAQGQLTGKYKRK
jgi:Raf kinase inhibitor-like YbhB/YbcL family protein